ncbi:hypothetical protein SBRCBS47491_005254 [Sporothrix bragantina]|uniref:Uncharacterized protein n=1 Tax=Sporothrix bragantina TaxID=671064 RepID=A0ABP0BV68_9PEZI
MSKRKKASQERVPQPLQSPLRRNPTRQTQVRQNPQLQNPFHRAPVLHQELLKKKLEQNAAEDLTTMANRRRKQAYATVAERMERQHEREDEQLAQCRAEWANRQAYYKQNPFASQDTRRYLGQQKPPQASAATDPTAHIAPERPAAPIRWSRWVPVDNLRGGRNVQRRKCSYCNRAAAVLRQRVLLQQDYEILDLCYLCEMKRQRSEILLDDEQWDLVYESSSEEEDDDIYSATDTSTTVDEELPLAEAAAVAVAPRQPQRQVIQLPVILIRAASSIFCDIVWTKNPVPQLAVKATSLNLLGKVRGFVTSQMWQPVTNFIGETAFRARQDRRGSPRRRNSPQAMRPVRASPPVAERPLRAPAGNAAAGLSPPRRRSPNQQQQNRVQKAASQFRRYTKNDPRLFFGLYA